MFKPYIQQMATPIKIQSRHSIMVKGAPEITYVDADPPIAMCNWKGMGGSESTASGMLIVTDTATITMWFRPDITEQTRILLGEKAYEVINIEDIEQRHQYLIVKVKRAVGA